MFQRWERDVPVDLVCSVSIVETWTWGGTVSYVLFHILLSNFDGALTHLKAHLCRVIVHETAKRGGEAGRRI